MEVHHLQQLTSFPRAPSLPAGVHPRLWDRYGRSFLARTLTTAQTQGWLAAKGPKVRAPQRPNSTLTGAHHAPALVGGCAALPPVPKIWISGIVKSKVAVDDIERGRYLSPALLPCDSFIEGVGVPQQHRPSIWRLAHTSVGGLRRKLAIQWQRRSPMCVSLPSQSSLPPLQSAIGAAVSYCTPPSRRCTLAPFLSAASFVGGRYG